MKPLLAGDSDSADQDYGAFMGLGLPRGDVALAGAMLLLSQVEVWSSVRGEDLYVCAVAGAVAAAAMAWRRSRPIASALVVLGALAVVSLLGRNDGLWPIVALVVSMYSVGRHAPTAPAAGLLVIALAVDSVTGIGEDNDSFWQWLGNYLFIAALLIAIPWTAGLALRRRDEASVKQAVVAVGEERLRIARELHDVVGHSLGVIAVQAGAERATLPHDAPQSTMETLITIEETTREALTEMRRLLSVMRTAGDSPEPTSPQPDLMQVDALLRAIQGAGFTTDLQILGTVTRLSPGVELAAYRIVQEAVTNSVRHSGGTHVWVTLRYEADRLGLEIVDDGKDKFRPGRGGFGLAGMRERAHLYGGTVTTQRRQGGGLAVRALLPYLSADA